MPRVPNKLVPVLLAFAALCLLLAVLMSISGCAPAETGVQITDSTNVYRYVDAEAGVVCWIYNAGWKVGGISCLPIGVTELEVAK